MALTSLENFGAIIEQSAALLDALGVNMALEGAKDMAEFAGYCWAFGGRSGDALRAMARARSTYYLALNSRMRAACRCVLEAVDAALAAAGLTLRARNPYALAEALARLFG